ncbi:diadenylate cyclase [Ferruginibacter sp. SUN002]|uniref:diadenylate cyclase n=1 Tax=Ferruginibacter sp. SUN002 TaxID=2937789 RepID=UPI003D35BC0A
MVKIKSGYPQLLKYFMWEWQVYFLISAKVRAESLFNEINRKLDPVIFMIGVSTEDQGSPLICYEPEDMDYLENDIDKVKELAELLDSKDPDRNMYYTGDGMNAEMKNRRVRKNFRLAIERALDESESFTDKIHFVANPVNRNGYDVFIVLQLNRTAYNSHVFLHKVDPEERLKKHLSLIEAAKDIYLENQSHLLHLPNAGRDRGPERDSTELLRLAAKNFLYTIGLVGRSDALFKFQPACDAVSLTSYERSENEGYMIIAQQEHEDIEMILEIDSPFLITEYRKLRKELQLTGNGLAVITDGHKIYGLGKQKNTYNPAKEDIFHVFFRGKYCYDIVHNESTILRMRYGSPDHTNEQLNKESFALDARRIFPGITSDQINNVYNLSMILAKQDRGSMLVCIDDAANEANRLHNQCIGIKPVKLDAALLINLSSIDGAVIVDRNGIAYAKGAILDGVVGFEGDASRGSRYNSAITYYEHRGWEKPTMIIVISEDGMVDVIPTLMPQIMHSEITKLINILEGLSTPETFERTTFYEIMNLLQRRKFYLTNEECNNINLLKTKLEKLDQTSGEYTMWIKHDNFVPNRLMNNRYYLKEKEEI